MNCKPELDLAFNVEEIDHKLALHINRLLLYTY